MNKIIINRGSFKLKELVFEQGTTTIGRASDNTIVLDDTAVSSHHARVVTFFHTSYIEDLNSTNGTLVNGKPVQKRTLYSGDVISMGNHQLLFQSDKGAQKAESSETVLLQGNEVKQKLNEFLQAQLELEQPGNAALVNEANKTPPATLANEAVAAPKAPAATASASTAAKSWNPDIPPGAILDKEKNRAWLEPRGAARDKHPVTPSVAPQSTKLNTPVVPNTEVPSAAVSKAAVPNTAVPSAVVPNAGVPAAPQNRTPSITPQSVKSTTPAVPAQPQARTPPFTPKITPATIKPEVKPAPTTPLEQPMFATEDDDVEAEIAPASEATPVIRVTRQPQQMSTVELAAAIKAARESRRMAGNDYASGPVLAVSPTKPRNRLTSIIWVVIVAVLVFEVIYISYRSLG